MGRRGVKAHIDAAAVIDLWKLSYTQLAIARHLKCSRQRVAQILVENGLLKSRKRKI